MVLNVGTRFQGLGPIGQCVAQFAKLKGAKRIIGVDRVPERLAFAQEKTGVEPLDFSKHTDVVKRDCNVSVHVDFLHVRWFGQVKGDKHGDKHMRLEQLTFIPDESDIQVFGFISPRDVIRRAHLIPAFDMGRTDTLLGPSPLARVNPGECATDDYDGFYMNRSASFPYRSCPRLTFR